MKNNYYNKSSNDKTFDPIKDSLVYNERIKYQDVRVLDENGEQLAILNSRQALQMARDKGLDLIEIAADAKPPVVRFVKLDKWIYTLKKNKKEQEKKARENATVMKEIQLRPVTDKHDIEIKQGHAKEFLADSAKVKIVIRFKGREIGFADKGFSIMNAFISGLGPCKVEKEPELSGKILSAIIAPVTKNSKI